MTSSRNHPPVEPLGKLLSAWRAKADFAGNVVEWRSHSERLPKTHPLPVDLHPELTDALRSVGIQTLYTHQSKAWEDVQAGKNIVIVTGTASGKTLCYNLPVLNRLLQEPDSRALYIFPTKALAQDQIDVLHSIARQADWTKEAQATPYAAIYDGDTPAHARPAIRTHAHILITNPDMLHIGILPHHTRWEQLLRGLRFVVLDEVHTYRGVFGSHITNVIRRLKRIARFYGATPQFILTSATIANPIEFTSRLIEAPVEMIDEDGSPRGPRHFLIYNPPVIDQELGLRKSAYQESVHMAEDLLAHNIQTILFARSRRSVELLLTYLRNKLPSVENNITETVRGYRSGYLSQERRTIERGLRQGSVRTVVATTALELGIDIGGLGAAILVGYPGSIAATLQQAGRAGRGTDPALAILVTTADPLDQFLAAHPEYIFERSPEHALINPDNLLILLDHLRCAAFELPFQSGDRYGSLDPEPLTEFLQFLVEQGVLHRSGSKFFWISDSYPAQNISLRSASANPVILYSRALPGEPSETEKPQMIGQVDQASAHWMVHPQAIYLHEGQNYLVDELDLEHNTAWLHPTDEDYYTTPQIDANIQLLQELASEPAAGVQKTVGEIQVTTQVTGYRKIRWYTNELIGQGEVTLPSTELLTTGYWLALEESTVETLRQQGLWSSDPNHYGSDWSAQRDLARARDGFRCQLCGAPEQSRAHDVHHKTPFRAFTSARQANQLENLITLCHACHRRVETAVRVRSGLAGLAYVLSHLAPFFLMCDIGDLGVHSDPQSPITDGKPTVVLYDQIPAGIGLSQRLFELHDELMQRAGELVSACPCTDGCPSCVGPAGENGMGCKRETSAILASLVARN